MKRFLSVFLSLLLITSIIPITELNVDAAGNYEVESNNDYSSADVLTINNSISGKMDSTSDIDMYKITTSSNGKLSLSFTHNYKDSTAYWRVMIYQYSGGKYNELSSLDIKGNSDEVIELPSVGAVSGGVYYIKIYLTASYYDLVGVSYSLVNNFTVTDYYEKEVNNSYDTATSISLNQTYSGTMNSTSDVDMYKITTSNSGKLALNFKHKYIDSSAYWRVMIYQYSGGKYNELSSLDIKGNSDEVIELPSVGAVTGGDYYIKVYLTASYYDLVGLEYSLINSFTATNYYEKEINNSYDTATSISLNQTYSGTMNSTSDVDMYKITTSNSGKLALNFKHKYIDSSAYWRVMIYQYSGGKYNELSSLDIKGNSDEVIELPSVGAVTGGVYYIKVYLTASYYDLVGTEYSLTNSFTVTDYYEKEVNDSYDTSTQLYLNKEYNACMNRTSDKDYFKINLTSNETVNFKFSHTTVSGSSIPWKIKIFKYVSGSYTEIFSEYMYLNNGNITTTVNTAGTYYVMISTDYSSIVGVNYSVFVGINDTTKPTGSISSTNNVASSQTVTLNMSDNIEVAGYYWGTSSSYGSNTYTSTSSIRIDKTISTSGTYYLTVKDTSGNLSNTYSITFYKTTLNANGGSVSPSSIITASGNSFTFPAPTKSGYTYNGWSTSSSATGGLKTLTPTSNTTYYAVWTATPTPTITLSATSKSMTVGDTATLTATTTPSGQTVTWTSSNTSVATVSNGTITAKSAGVTTITAKFTYNGSTYSKTCSVTVTPVQTSKARIEVESKTASSGNEVKLAVSLGDNPGLAYLKLKVSYDSSALELVSAQNTGLLAGTFTTSKTTDINPYVIQWMGADDSDGNGTIVNLTFRVKDNAAEGNYTITLTSEEAYNSAYEDVIFTVTNGTVTVRNVIVGDVNGDGIVNGKDGILLSQYLAGWNATIVDAAADCNGDGNINGKDGILLAQYLAGWNVTLG